VTPTAHTSYSKKRLGGYLVEAGLLTPAQIDVALNDQKLTGMRFGEILAARGWVKTRAAAQQSGDVSGRAAVLASEASKQAMRRDAPIAKPLSSSSKPDGDVSWVG
jgi:hypothetical protein